MASKGDDCYFYYYSTCAKGSACPFRHCEAALGNEVECSLWREGRCMRTVCKFRHMEIKINRQEIECYWETQPSGCQKANCVFRHNKSRYINGLWIEPVERAGPSSHAVTQNAPKTEAPEIVPTIQQQQPKQPEITPSSAPIVQRVIINPNEESDADSIQGTPVKKPPLPPSPKRLTEISLSDKPKIISTRKPGTEETSQDLNLEIKSLEELRREKVRIARQLLAEAEKELHDSGMPVNTPPTKAKMSAPRLVPTKKVKLGEKRTKSPEQEIVIKSLEDIRREQALATLKRGAKRKSETYDKTPTVRSDEPKKKVALIKPTPASSATDEGGLGILSLEEIRREQALASMRKRVAEKAKAQKRQIFTKPPPRKSSTEERNEETFEPVVTRRIVISSDVEKKILIHKKKEDKSDSDSEKEPEPVKQISIVRRKISVQKPADSTVKKTADIGSVKSRLGPVGIKRRLGLKTSHREEETESHSRQSTPFTSEEDEEDDKHRKKQETKPSIASRITAPKKSPTLVRKISLATKSTSSESTATSSIKQMADRLGTKRAKKATPIQIYQPPAAKKGRTGESVSPTDEVDSNSRPAKGGRKPVEWGTRSYSELIKERQLAKEGESSRPKRISPIGFDDKPKRGLSPIRFDEDAAKRSKNSEVKAPAPRKGPKLVWSTRADRPKKESKSVAEVEPEPPKLPIRKLTLKTIRKKVDDTVTPSPIRPVFMRAKVEKTDSEVSTGETGKVAEPAKNESAATAATSERLTSQAKNSVASVVASPPPIVKKPTASRATPRRKSSAGSERKASISSNKSDKKPAAEIDGELGGGDMDLLDDDLIDLFTDDSTAAPVTTTATDDDDLLAQMEEFLA